MAKLEKYYNLCFINDIQEFPGISIDKEPRCIINTLGKNIIVTMRLSDQNQIHSWTTLDKLTNKVIYDFKTNQYVGVFSYNYIRCWNDNISDINKLKRIKLKNHVADLFTYEKCNSIILYKNGICESFETILNSKTSDNIPIESMKNIFDPNDYQILNPVYFRTTQNNILFTYFIKHIKSKLLELVYFKLNPETLRPQGDIKRRKIIRTDKTVRLTGYVVVDGAIYPNLVTLWSDNRIFMLQIRDDDPINNIDGPGYFTSMFNIFNMEQPLSVIGISNDCIAIYGANNIEEGASLIIYNTQFNIVRAKEYFKVYFKHSRMWIIEQQIFLAIGQNLAVVSFHISKEQLSDMIGAHNKTILSNYIDKDSINEEGNIEESLLFDGEATNQALISCNNYNRTNTIANTINEIRAYENIKKINDNLMLCYQYNPILKTATETNKSLLISNINYNICSNINGEFFKKNDVQLLLKEFENCGHSEREILDTIIPILIKCNLSNQILFCLKKYAIVSEKILVTLLKYAIMKLKTNETSIKNGCFTSSIDYNIIKVYRNILNMILIHSFSEKNIISYLRVKIEFNEAIFILNHIYNLLNLNTENDADDENQNFPNNYMEENQLILWFTVILDAHYQQFVIAKDPKMLNILAKWQTIIDEFLNYQQDLKNVLPQCYNLFNGKQISYGTNFSKWYSVEMVKLY